ncbi:MAG: tetraacyldisaccharide 4'-kinase [Proteobacteria bacterium]|nr:tetraacyldisaccharide 4'-kinase [Pseudomonadota bacterium]MBU1738522.1 tetraacyldisaccharide 4'-kinase [Pseudomonadota bacterium]
MSGIPRMAALFGNPFSPIYSALMKVRATAYRTGVFSSIKLEVPVVSIGNLTMGGSGKTPMVMAVARLLQRQGKKPAIISRGYGGRARGDVNLVSDGAKIFLNAEEAGDEPLLLAESLPGIPVVTGSQRKLTGPYAVKELGADLIIMDDGFQHLALSRDLDLVLFKAPFLLGDGRVFPGGYLREPISALARAHAFVINGVDELSADRVEEFAGYLAEIFPGRPIFKIGYGLGTPVDIHGKAVTTLQSGEKCFVFCGLADPESFRLSLKRSGYEIAGFQSFPDHHAYTAGDLEKLARKACGRTLLTTEKDLVKLKDISGDVAVYALPLALKLPLGLEPFLVSNLLK